MLDRLATSLVQPVIKQAGTGIAGDHYHLLRESGNVTNAPGTGYAASSNPLSTTIETPQVTIGGIPAIVSFSDLAPGFVGLYQVNAEVPAASPSGSAVPLVLTIAASSRILSP